MAVAGHSDLLPVIIVPGDGSNQLYARLDKPSRVRPWCAQRRPWFRLWLTAASLLNPLDLPCWADNMKLVRSSGVMQNAPGVQTRVQAFGDTSSMEILDPSLPRRVTAVWDSMVHSLVGAGLVRNVSIRGAPYDFRFSPRTDVGFFPALEALIVATSEAHNFRPVVVVTHSLGCLEMHAFLASRSQAWRERYISRWVAIAGPYGGTNSLLRLHASGDNVNLPISALEMREQQRTYETNAWMLPQPALWSTYGPLARTRERDYNVSDLARFLTDVGSTIGAQLLRDMAPLRANFDAPPRVPVDCVFSTGLPTDERFDWRRTKSFDEQPEVGLGDGDGTVNLRSLRICAKWEGAQPEPVDVHVLPGVTHRGMLMEPKVIQLVIAAASRPVVMERPVQPAASDAHRLKDAAASY